VASRKDLSIAPVLSGAFYFIYRASLTVKICYTFTVVNGSYNPKMYGGYVDSGKT
jgi:hypothetical protein